jgi:hypothetical protein
LLKQENWVLLDCLVLTGSIGGFQHQMWWENHLYQVFSYILIRIDVTLASLMQWILAIKENKVDKKTSFIPFRNSKLTVVMAHTLGYNCKTCFIFTVNPSMEDCSETLTTLRGAHRIKEAMCFPKKNINSQ